ncbi:MAG: ABC transporter permease [Phycisphaerales bacterium]|nr:MAG: ABC transporter permease [Phycisphaerales bacterium]
MRRWLRLATRSWRVKPGRTVSATVAIALGVGTVVSITCFYESVRRSIGDQIVSRWLGKSHLSIEPPLGHWGRLKQSLADQVAAVDNVAQVSVRLKRRMFLARCDEPGGQVDPGRRAVGPTSDEEVDAIGIDPATEYLFRDFEGLVGRRIKSGEHGVAMIEAATARRYDLAIGDSICMAQTQGGSKEPLEVVGLFSARRVAKFQRPNVILPLADLQRMKDEPGQLTVIDAILHDHSVERVKETARQVGDRLAALGANVQVTSAAARLEQLQEAERVTQMVLVLVAFVAMLTAFFIIVTTMGMGIVERIGQLGLMRCVGVTRSQLCALVMLEVLPLGVMGIALGLPIGVGMTRIGAAFVPEYVQGVAISRWGMGLAVAGGGITTVLSAVLLVFQVGRVSPLAAANPEARPTRLRWTVAAGAAGVVLILLHNRMVAQTPAESWFRPVVAFASVASIYGGYVLTAPVFAVLAGGAVVSLVAPVLRLRHRLARDQVSRAPWRSAGVCWMLMVGLSLIVYIAARGEGVIAAWDFPKKLPETFVWSWNRVSSGTRAKVESLDGVGDCTVVTDFPCRLAKADPESPAVESVNDPQGWRDVMFVAGELDRFLAMTKLSFVEGDFDDARAKLRRGGHIILPPEAAHSLKLTVGDKVHVAVGRRLATFEVAGVVQSPALDIAVTYFNADSYMMRAAAASVLGTVDDVEKLFGVDRIGMYMLNVELPLAPRPAAFDADEPPALDSRSLYEAIINWQDCLPNERTILAKVIPQLEARRADRSAPIDRLTAQTLRRYFMVLEALSKDWKNLSPANRWEIFREQLVLRKVAFAMGRSDAWVGSLRRLKQQIDHDIREVTLLMSAMPAVALAVAALGVANLMMVSVTSRTRQIAVLRAVGATKSQIVRLVFAETITLGILGCIAGILLGVHTSRSAALITERIVGMEFPLVIPWGHVGSGVALTVGVCILAGIGPARHAARNNIVDAMQAR